ncbi:MAG: hypothetical protein LC789_02240 [Actinobacteria bacterium]|nr:hypothetical protein [Actinomycetota bacterium]MCA1719991.1 hypothetical protein [Actinomycetota bacterium]
MSPNLRTVLFAAVLGLALGGGAFALSRGGADSTPRSEAAVLPTVAASGSPSTLPPESAAEPNGRYYAVFLAVARDANDPDVVRAQRRATELGYNGGLGDIDCTAGARSRLGLPAAGTYTAFSVFFDTAELAGRFARAYGTGVVGTAQITAGCLD